MVEPSEFIIRKAETRMSQQHKVQSGQNV